MKNKIIRAVWPISIALFRSTPTLLFAVTYYNRGNLKANKLNDPQGSLADYNRAIDLNPKYATAYSNRGFLKAEKLNDRVGGVADFQQAARLYQQQGKQQNSQDAISQIARWKQTENNSGF